MSLSHCSRKLLRFCIQPSVFAAPARTRLFASAWTEQSRRMASTIADPTQRKLMEEQCILVNEKDEVVGMASKLDCHRRSKIESDGMLHRAFSVFLFNSKGELLMQERADCKVTFPGYATNTCCSHPLHVADELLNSPLALGVKRAAQRRMNYELGVPVDQVLIQLLYNVCDAFHHMYTW